MLCAVLILLPPSQSKASARSGRRLDLSSLSLPELTPAREKVLDALIDLCAHRPDAADVLALSPGLTGEVARNAALRTTPALPVGRLYTGVLYDALGLAGLDTRARRAAGRSLLIFSGLWGVVRIGDRVPPYRCSMGNSLPGIGPLARFWRGVLGPAVTAAAGSGLVLDLRSAEYASAWSPAGDVAGRTFAVRVLHERVVRGVLTRTVVSHFNKETKGRLVRDVLSAGTAPRRPAELVALLGDLGYRVEAQLPERGRPGRLDVVLAGA
jgi:cytoplasmic iron level regulating protein YaaA (DUF328/UPF0246 family)